MNHVVTRSDTMNQPVGGPANAAELLVRCLENESVTVVFGIPGEENIYLTKRCTALAFAMS